MLTIKRTKEARNRWEMKFSHRDWKRRLSSSENLIQSHSYCTDGIGFRHFRPVPASYAIFSHLSVGRNCIVRGHKKMLLDTSQAVAHSQFGWQKVAHSRAGERPFPVRSVHSLRLLIWLHSFIFINWIRIFVRKRMWWMPQSVVGFGFWSSKVARSCGSRRWKLSRVVFCNLS